MYNFDCSRAISPVRRSLSWDMAAILLLALLFILGAPSSRGAGLLLNGRDLTNVSLVRVTANLQEIECVSDNNAVKVGDWLYPSGTLVQEGAQPPVYAVYRSFTKRAELHVKEGLLEEGIYTCRIANIMYYVGLYNPAIDDGAPNLEAEVSLSVMRSDQVLFSLSCSSSSFPPTSVTWLLDGLVLPLSMGQSSFQVLREASSSRFDNVLHVSESIGGTFTCQVNNSAGMNSRSILIRVPPHPPSNVTATSIGKNSVRVSWTPPPLVSQYVVTYGSSSPGSRRMLEVDGRGQDIVLTDLVAGVMYWVRVEANGDIPGPASSPVNFTITAPPPPNMVFVVSSKSMSLTLMWEWSATPPSDIRGYLVSYVPVNGSCESVAGGRRVVARGDITMYVLEDLEEFVNYSVEVQAEGKEGYGHPSVPVSGKTLPAVPDPPVLKSAVTSDPSSLLVSWWKLGCQNINSDHLNRYVVRYGNTDVGEWEASVDAQQNSTHINVSQILPFMEYSLAVAAMSSEGLGNYSVAMMAVILRAPDAVVNLRASPDITSLQIFWDPPADEGSRQYLTTYRVETRLFKQGSNPLKNAVIGKATTTHEVEGLLPNLTYEVEVQALVGNLPGDPVTVVISTEPIGQVEGVRVEMLSSSSVNVSWIPLQSNDIVNYLVDYFQMESINTLVTGRRKKRQGAVGSVTGRAEFPGSSSWGVIDDLRPGTQYEFQVTAAVLLNGGVRGEGKMKSLLTVESAVALTPAGGGISDAAIAGIIVAAAVVCVIVGVLVFVAFKLWHRERRGKFVIRRHSYAPQPDRPSSIMHPLPDFEPFISTAKPAILRQPEDVTAMEGERVSFKPHVTGMPTPTVAWYHDGELLTSDYATEVSDEGYLTFVCVETKHAGIYRFTVSNSAGSLQGQVQLSVVTEDQQRDERCQGTVESSRVRVEDFGGYCEELHASNDRGFREQFYKLPSGEEDHSAKWGQHPEHRSRNRFTNIIVYDDNRVKLKPITDLPDYQHDYVNASPVNGYFMSKKFIATQGPTDNTVVDFWRLVWQLRTPTIVMITNLTEKGKSKCARYWPERAQEDYGPFRVVVSGEKVYSNYTIRSFHVNFTLKQQNPLKVVQYQFTSWPDHGVPDYVGPMLSFHRRIKAEHLSMLGPILVHCSAGVGRSGTYVSIDIALQQASGEGYIDIPAIITGLRNQRMKMVQTQDQYKFVHDAVLESMVCGKTQIFIHEMQQAMENLQRWDSKTGRSGFQTQFQALDQMSPKVSDVICTVGERLKQKNRPGVLLPADKHRVVLRAEQPDYINASFVHGYSSKNKYIITQGPMNSTSRDFWKMVYDRNATCIVMLSGMIEDDEEVCHKYWPTRGIENFGEFSVSLLEQSMHDSYLERIYSITDSKSGQAHRVTQFQVINWDQYGVMLNRMAILNIIIAATTRQNANQLGPIVVHCSDTVTRSAIFCAVSNVMECCKIEGVVDVFQTVKILRCQRPGAIPSVEHYQIIHDFVLYFVQNMLPC